MKPNTLTKTDLYNRNHYLTVGALRKALSNPNLKDDSPVLVQRVEDRYFENNNWSVYMKKGEMYWNQHNLNIDMQEEIDRRARGEEPECGMEHPEDYIMKIDEEWEFLEQYIPTWCVINYGQGDEDILFIDLHY